MLLCTYLHLSETPANDTHRKKISRTLHKWMIAKEEISTAENISWCLLPF